MKSLFIVTAVIEAGAGLVFPRPYYVYLRVKKNHNHRQFNPTYKMI